MAIRPTSVPTQAIEVYPNAAGTPPSWDPQMAAIEQFQTQVATLNRNAGLNYAGAYQDWQANASQYAALHMPIPPAPLPPVARIANVAWSDNAGDIQPGRVGSEISTAWIWES
jgi:hypothetical protein